MFVNLTAVPTKWDASPLGFIDEKPRGLKSFLLQALAEAQISPTINGQRTTEDPASLLKRFLLASKIEHADEKVDVSSDEFSLIEQCVAALFKEAASVRLVGCLHHSVGGSEKVKAVE